MRSPKNHAPNRKSNQRKSVAPPMMVEQLESRTLLSGGAVVSVPGAGPLIHTPVQTFSIGHPKGRVAPTSASGLVTYKRGQSIAAHAGESFNVMSGASAPAQNTRNVTGTVVADMYLSTNSSINGAIRIGQASKSVNLAPGDRTVWTVRVKVPSGTKAGSYNIVARDDFSGTDASNRYTPLIFVTNPITIGVPSLALTVSNGSRTIALGSVSPKSGNAPLRAEVGVTNKLQLWLGITKTDVGAESSKAVDNADNAFGKLGVLSPAGTALFNTIFDAPGDALRVNVSMTPAAAVLNVLDIAIPLKGLKSPADLVQILDKMYSQTPLGDAANDFKAALSSGSVASVIKAAKKIAGAFSFIAKHPTLLKELKSLLRPLGIVLTKAAISKLNAVGTIINLSEKFIDSVDLGATELVTGTIAVTFTAKAK